jgi:hypothetical protein
MSEDLEVANSELLSSTLTMSAHPSPFEPICELMASKMTLRRQESQQEVQESKAKRGKRVRGQFVVKSPRRKTMKRSRIREVEQARRNKEADSKSRRQPCSWRGNVWSEAP